MVIILLPNLRFANVRNRSNGRTNGISLPSADGQEAVIRKAYANANLPVTGTDYIEVIVFLSGLSGQ